MKLFKHSLTVTAAALLISGLAACGQTGSRNDGIEVGVKALPLGAPTHAPHDTAAKSTPTGESFVQFRRSDGMRIDLQLGYLNLLPVALETCDLPLAARLAPFNPLGSALAHGGHGGEAPDGALTVVGGEAVSLGSLRVTPGRYCGLQVAVSSVDGALGGVAPCYYPTTLGLDDSAALAASEHSCVEAEARGATRTVTLPFSSPVVIETPDDLSELTVTAQYERWFDEVNMATLSADTLQQDRLLQNMLASLQVRTDAEQTLSMAFDYRVNGEPALCGSVYPGVGNGAQQDYELRDYRFYMADPRLEGPSGSTRIRLADTGSGSVYQDDDHTVALLGQVNGCDATVEARRVSRVLHGVADAGTYDRMCFSLGLPFALNHLDIATAPSPLNVTAMNWSWLGGRKFLKIDGLGDADDARTPFNLHVGSTQCDNGGQGGSAPPSQACAQPHVAEVCLDLADIASGHAIVVDPAAVLADVDIASNTPMTAPGCMSGNSDPECQTVMPKLGLDFEYNGTLLPAQPQALFSVGH